MGFQTFLDVMQHDLDYSWLSIVYKDNSENMFYRQDLHG